MSRFTVRCIRALNLRVARNAAPIRHAPRISFNRARLPPCSRVHTAPRNFMLLLSTVFAASLDEQDEQPASYEYTSIIESENVLPIKKVSDLEATLSDAGDKLVVIFCMVRWCPFCRKIAPTVEDIAANGPQNLVMLKLDMDDQETESSRILARYNAFYVAEGRFAVGLPTFVFLRGGTKLEHFTSADDGRLRGAVKKYTQYTV